MNAKTMTPEEVELQAKLLQNPLILNRAYRQRIEGAALPPLSEGGFPWSKTLHPNQPMIFQGSLGTAEIAANVETALTMAGSYSQSQAWTSDSTTKQITAKSGDVRAWLNRISVHIHCKTDIAKTALADFLAQFPTLELLISQFERRNDQPHEIAVNLAAVADFSESPGGGAAGNVAYVGGAADGAVSATAGFRDVGLVDFGFARDWVAPEAVYLGRAFRVAIRNGPAAITPPADVLVTVALDLDVQKLRDGQSDEAAKQWADKCGPGPVRPERIQELAQLAPLAVPPKRISRKK